MIDFGLTPQDFRCAYFEKEPHLFRSALAERPFTWPDLDELLHIVTPGAPVMRLFHHGVVPDHEFTEDTVVLGRHRRKLKKVGFYRYMRNGATLVINRLEDFSVEAKRLCVEIARFAGAQSSGNAYVSFNGDGTFGKHWDTHDVFVVQLIGRKRWKIFSPTWRLPLTYQTNDRSGHECPAEPALELTVDEGDVLYLPRGWWHHAIPLDEGSFHLSVGTYSPTLYDYVLWVSSKYLEQQTDVRRAFSRGDYREALAETLRQLPAVLLDPTSAEEFERDAIARQSLDAEFNTDLFLEPHGSSLRADAVVSLTTFHAPQLEHGEVPVNGSRLTLDPESQAVVAALRDCNWLGFDALCERVRGLSQEAVRRAVIDLARHDVVTVHQRRERPDSPP